MKDLIGLAVLAWPLTLIVLVLVAFTVVISLAVVFASHTGRSKWRWALGGFLLVFLLIFWDWIPTVAMHQYYCATEAGFWVYKTVDQWKAENPGVIETLVENKGAPSTSTGDDMNYTDTYFLNQRINKVVKKTGPDPFNVWRWDQEVIDSKTNEVLARSVGFSTGNGKIGGEPELRFWLHSDGCTGGGATNDSRFHEFKHQLLGRKL
jgi:hypothetical protein